MSLAFVIGTVLAVIAIFLALSRPGRALCVTVMVGVAGQAIADAIGNRAAARVSDAIAQITEISGFSSEQFLLGAVAGLVVALIIVAIARPK